MKKHLSYGYFLLAILILAGCNGGSIKNSETPTSGNIRIGVDESYHPMIKSQIGLFQSIYEYAIINAEYGPEADIIERILNDSVRIVITNRQLTRDEQDFLSTKKIVPKTTKIAYDGLAFIVNKSNTDSTLKYDQIRRIFAGTDTTWKQINPASALGKLDVIFDNNRSGNPRFIRDKFKLTGQFPENCFAVNSNEEVIRYVEENPHALGIISVNWISDKDDTVSNKFRKSIKVVGIGNEADTDGFGSYSKPYQGYLADGTYPFIREVYVINCETFSGLGTGFAAFIAGEKGQRVILKSGLVPATMPIRLVQFK